ncbi:MAG: hypothetical protein EOP51_01155 [Sphingobacteriales bacterium]|nr:MAG: hypothetical protein EOP51_01155 [Sphingobacteriales bacterium]
MKKALLVLAMFPFVAMQCKPREGAECHYSIKVQNNSTSDIILATNGGDANGRMVANYIKNVSPNTVAEYEETQCWEYRLTNNSNEEILLLKANAIKQDSLVYIDSLVKYEQVLKRVSLGNNELKDNYFVITYP